MDSSSKEAAAAIEREWRVKENVISLEVEEEEEEEENRDMGNLERKVALGMLQIYSYL